MNIFLSPCSTLNEANLFFNKVLWPVVLEVPLHSKIYSRSSIYQIIYAQPVGINSKRIYGEAGKLSDNRITFFRVGNISRKSI